MKKLLFLSLLLAKFCIGQNHTSPPKYAPNVFLETAYSISLTSDQINTLNFAALFGSPLSKHIWLGAGFGVNRVVSKNIKGNMYPVFVEISHYQGRNNPKPFFSARFGAAMAGKTTFPYLGLRFGTRPTPTKKVRTSFYGGLDFTNVTINYYESNGSFIYTPEKKRYAAMVLGLSISF